MMKFELFDSLLEPVFILDQDARVHYCNEAAALLCGSTIRKIQRQKNIITELLVFDQTVEWISQLDKVKEATPYKELRFKNQNGDEGRIQMTAQLISENNEEPRWVTFIRDVTLEERLQKKYRAELGQKEDVISELQKAQNELQNYSRNLESMVEERTREVKELNIQMKALLDSLSQGFLIFNAQGDCQSVFSKACLTTLEKSPYQQKIWDVLGLDAKETETFKKWTETLFGDFLPFEDLKPLGPEAYHHSQGRNIALDYFPLMSWNSKETKTLEGVVLVASDITDLKEAQTRAEEEKKSAQFILSLVQKQNEIGRFVSDAQKIISQIHNVSESKAITENQESLFRWIHTLKGGSGSFTITHVVQHCHEAESLLSQIGLNPTSDLIQKLIHEIKQIETAFDQFLTEARQILGTKAFSTDRYVQVKAQELQAWAEQLKSVSSGQAFAEQIYNQYINDPIEKLITPYNDMMQKLAEQQFKQATPIQIESAGLTLPSDKYSALFASFVHIFRNIIDHGLETPDERAQAQKNPFGHVTFKSFLAENPTGLKLMIKISDDGRGINPAIIRNKLKSLNINNSTETDEQVIQHIFDPQFSTKSEITEISGRGVGLDAVKFEVEHLGGRIWVDSKLGLGTTTWIELPWQPAVPYKKAA